MSGQNSTRSQKLGESFEQVLTEISLMAERCDFRGLRDELVRDRIVVGILDKKLSSQLQEDPHLTLEKAIIRAKAREAIKKQSGKIQEFYKMCPLSRKSVGFILTRPSKTGKGIRIIYQNQQGAGIAGAHNTRGIRAQLKIIRVSVGR